MGCQTHYYRRFFNSGERRRVRTEDKRLKDLETLARAEEYMSF